MEFEQFADAVTDLEDKNSVWEAENKTLNRITVLGGNGDALLLATACLAEGADVTLFTAYNDEMERLVHDSGISIRGAGHIGNYTTNNKGNSGIRTTSHIDTAINNADVVFLTGPIHKQRTYAMVIARLIQDGQIIVLVPGRTFGVIEIAWLLKIGGVHVDYSLVEIQGLPYWYSMNGNTLTLSDAVPMGASILPNKRKNVLNSIKRFFPNLTVEESVIHSAFRDGSGLVESVALLLGSVAMEKGTAAIPDESEALPENSTFRTLIGKDHVSILKKLTEERMETAFKFGVRSIPSAEEFVDIYAGTFRGNGSRPKPTPDEARDILRCAAMGSLIPVISAANLVNVKVPVTQAMVALVSSFLGVDVSMAGRRLETIGINSGNLEKIRNLMDFLTQSSN